MKDDVAARFKGLETEVCPFDNLPEARGTRRGEALTAEAVRKYRWLKQDLRHSPFVALRDDEAAREVVREKAIGASGSAAE